MTGNARRSGPPWSVDLLADLHAGALDAPTEAELRPRAESDPEALEILAALDATLRDLRNLPPIPMPANVAARLDAAIANEARTGARIPVQGGAQDGFRDNVVDLASRRRKRLGWGAGLLAAAAVAVGVTVMALPDNSAKSPDNVAQPPRDTPVSGSAIPGATPGAPDPGKVPAVRGEDFGPVVGDVLKAQNYGPLENQETLAGCLQGANIAASKPLGVSPITLDDKPAVMALLPGGSPGAIKIVVLDPDTCGPDNPNGVLAKSDITPR